MEFKNPAVGIDLGTSYSCIGVLQKGRFHRINTDRGSWKWPSYVAITSKGVLVGEKAREQAASNPQNTVFEIKRLIGIQHDDPNLEYYIDILPFNVVKDDSNVKIRLKTKDGVEDQTPEFFYSILLSKMKEAVESRGFDVNDAVITVPSYFNKAQCKATLVAAQSAGWNVLSVTDETLATTVAYLTQNNVRDDRNLLVVDLGSGSFDASVISFKSEGPFYNVKSSVGDINLSGKAIEYCLMYYLHQELFGPITFEKNSQFFSKLRISTEKLMALLSSNKVVAFKMKDFIKGSKFTIKVTLEKFEELCDPICVDTLRLVEKALEYAKLDKDDINDLVMVGGCTKIPKIQSIIKNFFDGKSLTMFITDKKPCFYGAAIEGAYILSGQPLKTPNKPLGDIAPLSIGLESVGGIMEKVIERNTKLPCIQKKIFTTHYDNQTAVGLEVFQGERPMTKDNTLIGRFVLDGIPQAPRRVPVIEVTFKLETDGTLHIMAMEASSGISKNIKIEHCLECHSNDSIERKIEEAELSKKEDTAEIERIEAINKLENYIYSMKKAVEETSETVKDKCAEAMMWVSKNIHASTEEYEEKLFELHIECASYISEMVYTSSCSS